MTEILRRSLIKQWPLMSKLNLKFKKIINNLEDTIFLSIKDNLFSFRYFNFIKIYNYLKWFNICFEFGEQLRYFMIFSNLEIKKKFNLIYVYLNFQKNSTQFRIFTRTKTLRCLGLWSDKCHFVVFFSYILKPFYV